MGRRKMGVGQVMRLPLILKMDIHRVSGNFTKKKGRSIRTQRKMRMVMTRDPLITMKIGRLRAFTLRI
jgi:TPP-dependent pyruvate/acetoin dehydrogenase alpha subunit